MPLINLANPDDAMANDNHTQVQFDSIVALKIKHLVHYLIPIFIHYDAISLSTTWSLCTFFLAQSVLQPKRPYI